MDDNKLLSIGIDIGTTTTQVLVSELAVGTASDDGAEKLVVTDREILHRGAIHRTRLLDSETVDMDATAAIVRDELADAGFASAEIDTGAVIVTGETADKKNAEPLIHRLAIENGEFVAAAAGAALEAILAGRGAGTAARTTDTGETIANVDIGGGTTNIAVFDPAGVRDTRCLDVGGRLVEFDAANTVTKLSDPARHLVAELDLPISVGKSYDRTDLQRLIAAMAECVVDAITGPPFTERTHAVAIGSLPTQPVSLDGMVFTGGVGRLVNTPPAKDDRFDYGDIGSLLAAAVRERTRAMDLPVFQPDEDLQATVIGVGTQTTRLSGRTIMLDESLLPLRNLPVLSIEEIGEADRETLVDRVREAVSVAHERYGADEPFVLSFPDIGSLTYQRIRDVAHAISVSYASEPAIPAVVLTRQDCAKALGQTLTSSLDDRPVMVFDEVHADDGDYLDIGAPLAGSDTVPIVVKTLAFGN